MKKNIFKFLFMALIVFSNLNLVNAANAYTTISSPNEIPTTFSNSIGYISASKAQLTDYIGYFTGENAGWQPRIKYIGANENSIENYLFCLSYHDLAPTSNITYYKMDYDTKAKMNQVRYIIENGFNGNYANNYEALKYDYYVTQLALWQLQGMNGFDITYFETSDIVTKNKILQLVQSAKNAPMDNTKYVGKYVANQDGYQIIVPNIIYEIEEVREVTPVIHVIPDTDEYEEDHKNYFPVEPDVEENNKQISISYKDKCNNEYILNANMRLVDEFNKEIISWTSTNYDYVINNLYSGTYTIEDLTNNVSMTIKIEDKEELQRFSFTNNPDYCVEEEKSNIVNPDTGIAENLVIGGILMLAIMLYVIANKKLKEYKKQNESYLK